MRFNWSDKGNRIFWFAEKDGVQVLVRPDGTTRADGPGMSEPEFKTRQGQEGYRRSLLLMREYGIWDATAFGATMRAVFGFKLHGDAYLFSSCENAEVSIYPFLDQKTVDESCRLVDGFYADPNTQAGWPSMIVHPVCFKVTEEAYRKAPPDEAPALIPAAISDIGSSQDVLDDRDMWTLGKKITHASLDFFFDTDKTSGAVPDEPSSPKNSFLEGNEIIEQAIAEYHKDTVSAVLGSIKTRMLQNGHFLIPVETSEDGKTFSIRTVSDGSGNPWMALFTSSAEYEKGPKSDILSNFMDTTLKSCLDTGGTGFVINPWGQSFLLRREMIETLFEGPVKPEPAPKPPRKPERDLEGLVLTLKSKEKDCHATGILQKKKKLLVKAGSKISLESRLHLVASTQKNALLRSQLIESGIIKDRVFTEDYLFNSPSQAASVLLGASFSGNDRWRDKKGVTLGKRLGKE